MPTETENKNGILEHCALELTELLGLEFSYYQIKR